MPPLTHKTALAIIPPEALWLPIQEIRKVYDRGFRRWMPHITMLYPFRPQEEFESLSMGFAQAIENFQPFEIRFADFRFFQHGNEKYTLWLAPEPAEKVIQLQAALWKVVPDCDAVSRYSKGFTPHLSVGIISGKSGMQSLRNALQKNWQPISFLLDSISLICRKNPPEDVFRVVMNIKLCRGRNS